MEGISHHSHHHRLQSPRRPGSIKGKRLSEPGLLDDDLSIENVDRPGESLGDQHGLEDPETERQKRDSQRQARAAESQAQAMTSRLARVGTQAKPLPSKREAPIQRAYPSIVKQIKDQRPMRYELADAVRTLLIKQLKERFGMKVIVSSSY